MHTLQERSSKGTGERQATGKGRGGERGEGGVEGDLMEGRAPGMAGDCQGARPALTRGPEMNTEGGCNPNDQCSGDVSACMQGGG